jgi:queuine tRNA-ribosyltransferase
LDTIPYSRAYLHHLFKQNEPQFGSLASMHNLMEMSALMKDLREAITRDEV